MPRPSRLVAIGLLGLVLIVGLGLVALVPIGGVSMLDMLTGNTYTVERTDYTPPPPPAADSLLADDRIEDKTTTFDPGLVDRRPLEGWLVNASAAVIRLDVPLIKPDFNPEMAVLYPSYAVALAAAKGQVLPSVNLVDGKAKQFDDGLVAALD
jgi:hypothetical protein